MNQHLEKMMAHKAARVECARMKRISLAKAEEQARAGYPVDLLLLSEFHAHCDEWLKKELAR